MDSISLVLAIATSKRWEMHHMDVKSDFIHCEIHEEIYMQNLEYQMIHLQLVYQMPTQNISNLITLPNLLQTSTS